MDVGVQVNAQPVARARVLHVFERWIGRYGGWSKDPVEAYTEVTANSNRTDFQRLTFDFG